MKKIQLLFLVALTGLVSCGPRFKNDASIGDREITAYRFLLNKLTLDMKKKFAGNMYQTDKITPSETPESVSIGIPNSTTYTFSKNNSKFIKGDLNNDKKWDLIICADFLEAYAPENKAYFIFLQGEKEYELFAELNASDMVWEFANKMNFKRGIFNLDSISGGMMIGHSKYRKGDESYFRDFSYRCNTEKFRINTSTKQLELVSQSELLKKNPQTGEFEKAEVSAQQ